LPQLFLEAFAKADKLSRQSSRSAAINGWAYDAL